MPLPADLVASISSPSYEQGCGINPTSGTWHITPAEIAAFGDNDNDREMLAHVGLGVAMRNGDWLG